MDADTLEALRGSIAKWEAIVEKRGEDNGCGNCPLCLKFNRMHTTGARHRYSNEDDSPPPSNCAGCPVAEATGQDYCDGSPYERYGTLTRPHGVAVEELAFLKSLLPPGVES